jgi:hemerythrin-like domain-containing protein
MGHERKMAGLLEGLIQDHQDLRRRLTALSMPLESGPVKASGRLDAAAIERLRDMERVIRDELKAHEVLEERFVQSLLKETGGGYSLRMDEIRLDRESILDAISILQSLTRLEEGVDAYFVRLAVDSVSYNLERHFEREESDVFPFLRRLLFSSADSRAARIDPGQEMVDG